MSIEIIIALLGALGVGGLLGSVLTRWYEQQKQTAEHDVKIFNQSNEILTYKKAGNELKSAIVFMHKTGFTLFLFKVKKIDRFRLQIDYKQQIQSGKSIDTKEDVIKKKFNGFIF